MQDKEILKRKYETRIALLSNRPKANNSNIIRKLTRQLRNLEKNT